MSAKTLLSIGASKKRGASGLRGVSASSIELTKIDTGKSNVLVTEYEIEDTPKQTPSTFGHLKGLFKIRSWYAFIIGNAVVLICVVSLGVVLGITFTKVLYLRLIIKIFIHLLIFIIRLHRVAIVQVTLIATLTMVLFVLVAFAIVH